MLPIKSILHTFTSSPRGTARSCRFLHLSRRKALLCTQDSNYLRNINSGKTRPFFPGSSQHDLPIWLEEFQRSPVHDMASENFLTVLLPLLAQVITQDGIYWISHFPDHHISRLLLQVFGPLDVGWAAEKRVWVCSSETVVQDRQIDRLNAGSQAALASVQTLVARHGGVSARIEAKVDIMGDVVATQQTTLRDVAATQQMILTSLNSIHCGGYNQRPIQVHHDATVSYPPCDQSNVSNDTPNSERSFGLQYENNDGPPYFGTTRQRMVELLPHVGQPPIPMGMPLSLQNLVFEHLELKLDDYKKENKKIGLNLLA